jgi:hypothetical protein
MVFFNKKIIFLILALLFAIISISYTGNNIEGYSNLTPGTYPISDDVPLLHEYPFKKNMGVSENTYQDNYGYYPVFGSSYGQYTNNVRYWSTPNNGQCSPAEFCGGLYDNKKIEVPQQPKEIPFSSPVIRVNYYGSHKLECPSSMEDDE